MNDIRPSPVRIETGLIQGIFSGPLTVYKSIPYAAPPVGVRWRARHPASPWQGVCRADAPHRVLRSCIEAVQAYQEGEVVGEDVDPNTGRSRPVHRFEAFAIHNGGVDAAP